MNRQRKVVITITYNEMGIIIDTKAEEVAQPNLQQTCNELATDCISRQAAIDALHMHLMYRMGTDSNKKRLDEWINNLPSAQPEVLACGEGVLNAQPEQRWIHVSEQLPEADGNYIVTVDPDYIPPHGVEQICILYWLHGRWWYWDDGEKEYPDPIIAWMPLPEPYRAKRRTDE